MGTQELAEVQLFISRLVRGSGPLAAMDWTSESDTASVKQLLLVFESQALQCVFDTVFSSKTVLNLCISYQFMCFLQLFDRYEPHLNLFFPINAKEIFMHENAILSM